MHKIEKNNLSVNQLVKEILERDIFLSISLKKGYANLSAVTRTLLPMVESRLGKKLNQEALMSALKRNRDFSTNFEPGIKRVLAQSSIKLTTGMVKIVIPNAYIQEFLDAISDEFVKDTAYMSIGMQHTTIILEERVYNGLPRNLNRNIIDNRKSVSVMHILSPESVIETPGFLVSIYERLAMAGINVEETTNSYTDAIIVVKDHDAGEAFTAISDLIKFSRINI